MESAPNICVGGRGEEKIHGYCGFIQAGIARKNFNSSYNNPDFIPPLKVGSREESSMAKCIYCREEVKPEEQSKEILPPAHHKCVLFNRRYEK